MIINKNKCFIIIVELLNIKLTVSVYKRKYERDKCEKCVTV